MIADVFAQSRASRHDGWKLGMKRVFLDMIPVVVGLKPAVDAYRVASRTNQEEGQLFNPLGEMVSKALLSCSGGVCIQAVVSKT